MLCRCMKMLCCVWVCNAVQCVEMLVYRCSCLFKCSVTWLQWFSPRRWSGLVWLRSDLLTCRLHAPRDYCSPTVEHGYTESMFLCFTASGPRVFQWVERGAAFLRPEALRGWRMQQWVSQRHFVSGCGSLNFSGVDVIKAVRAGYCNFVTFCNDKRMRLWMTQRVNEKACVTEDRACWC